MRAPLLVLLLSACDATLVGADGQATDEVSARDEPRGSDAPAGWLDPHHDDGVGSLRVAAHAPGAPPPRRTVFVQLGGECLDRGDDDAHARRSSLVHGHTCIDAYQGSSADRAIILSTVRAAFAPWRLDVVERRPAGDTDYLEAVVGGPASAVSPLPNLGGISPLPGCEPNERAVVFAFTVFPTATPASGPMAIGNATAHEIGHALGLSHDPECTDIMSYGLCAPKSFEDVESACGVAGNERCLCAWYSRQDTRRRLDFTLGRKEAVPRALLLAPAVSDGPLAAGAPLHVEAEVGQERTIVGVEAHLKGSLVARVPLTGPGPIWRGDLPSGAPAGKLKIMIVATDDQGRTGASEIERYTVR